MAALLPVLFAIALVGGEEVATQFMQVYPLPESPGTFLRREGQQRAILLVPGLKPHTVRREVIGRPEIRSWQRPNHVLVRTVAGEGDVFAVSYSQNAAVDEIAVCDGMRKAVAQLRHMAYPEIVLVGHSAGAIVVRQFVEDFPDAGVTKVIQVAPPNGGSGLGRVEPAVRDLQEPFVHSLSVKGRAEALACRADKRIPPHIQFVCVVANGAKYGDGVVLCRRQWTDDLQAQGIPAVTLPTDHFAAIRGKKAAPLIARLVREEQPRWSPRQVQEAKREILGVSD